MRGLSGFVFKTPAGHLLVVWLLAVGAFAFGPIRYDEPPQLRTWIFVCGCMALFSLGSFLGLRAMAHLQRPDARAIAAAPLAPRIDLVVQGAALVGLFGAACIAVDKVVLSGLDFSQGVTAVRFAREQAVADGTALALPRSPLLYLGYVTFSFGVAAYLLSLLKGEILRTSSVWLAFAALAAPFTFSYLYGGRSPLFLVLGMAGGALVVRALSHQKPFPRGRTAPLLFAAFAGLTLMYSNWIVSERFMATGAENYADLERRFETTYGARVAPLEYTAPSPLDSAADEEPSGYERLRMQAVLYSYYLSHEVPMLERTLRYDGPLGPYYGAYQFYLAAAFVERVVPFWNFDAIMIPQLRAANVYGWFSTAWGGMYLDFGLVGALVAVSVCGWLAGRVYRRALVQHEEGSRLLMCYAVAGIIATPILSIFTISISLPILVALLVTAYLLRARVAPARAELQPGVPAPVP